MSDLKHIDEESLLAAIDRRRAEAIDTATRTIEREAKEAIEAVRDAAAAVAVFPDSTTALLRDATACYSAEFMIAYRGRSFNYKTPICLSINNSNDVIELGDATPLFPESNNMTRDRRYRVFVAFLPLDEEEKK